MSVAVFPDSLSDTQWCQWTAMAMLNKSCFGQSLHGATTKLVTKVKGKTTTMRIRKLVIKRVRKVKVITKRIRKVKERSKNIRKI